MNRKSQIQILATFRQNRLKFAKILQQKTDATITITSVVHCLIKTCHRLLNLFAIVKAQHLGRERMP